jgi:hypothetical protein
MGTWTGKLDVKRSAPTLDPGVADADWAADDGARSTGAASASIAVDAEGRLTGTLTGALGECDISGQTDGEVIRASLVSRGGEPGAMAGTLVASLVDGELRGELRASSADARLVRFAAVVLRRQ